MESLENRTDLDEVVKATSEEKGPIISDNVTKALEDCVRTMISNLPPSGVQKNKARIKRPMNAFMVYSQTARKAMARRYPTLSYRKLSKELGKIWKVLDDEEKKPFKREAERLREKHKQDYPNYKFKPTKARKPRSQTAPAKEYSPSPQDLIEILKTDEKQPCENMEAASPTFNGSRAPSSLGGNVFSETTLKEQSLSCINGNSEATCSSDFRSNENLRLEDELLPLLENILNGSEDILRRELHTTPPAISQSQPASNRGYFSDLLESFPVSQGTSEGNGLPPGNDPGLLFDYYNGIDHPYTSEWNGRSPGDDINFCNYITNDKVVSHGQIIVSPTAQDGFHETSISLH